MSTNGETADLMVREGIQITESALKLAGLGAKNLAALLIALANDNQKLAGKTNLKRLIHDGEELTIFSVKQEDLKGFQMEAKRYGVLFYPIINKVEKTGTVEIMVVDSTYHAASPEIVSAVEARIAASRPVGASPFVRAPGSVVLTVDAAVTINSAVTTLTEVKDQLQAGLEEYLHGLVDAKYGKIYYGPDEDEPYTLVYNRVLAILLTIPGVEDFSALTVNSGTGDLILQADQVPIVGKVIVT